MAERRSARTKRRPNDDELARLADDVFAEKPEDEAAEGAEDEVAEPEDEADEGAEDEAAEPEDEADEGAEDEVAEPEDEADEGAEDEVAEPEDEADQGAEDEVTEPEDEAERRPRRSRTSGLTAAKAGRAALRQITELTGKDSEGVTGVQRADDGGWQVGVEVVEDRRIPSSTDILATYDTLIDEDGELVSYRRVRRYSRGRGDDGDG